MHEHITGFKRTLALFSSQMRREAFETFTCLSEDRASLPNDDWEIQRTSFLEYLFALENEFKTRFPDSNADYSIVRSPFQSNPEAAILNGKTSIQLIDLQSNGDERKRHQEETNLYKFWCDLDRVRYRELRSFALRTLTYFGSTYTCESSFSAVNAIKQGYEHVYRMKT